MLIKICWGILVIFFGHMAQADVQQLQLDNREYLPPLKNKVENKPDNIAAKGYKYSKPFALDDPLPKKVDTKEQFNINFPKDEIIVKPIFKGALISGLFLPNDETIIKTQTDLKANDVIIETSPKFKNLNLPLTSTTIEIPKLSYQFENSDKSQKYKIQSNLHTTVDYGKISNSNEKNLENSFKTNKNFKKPHEDIVPINYREEATTEYKLFNYDDEIDLTSSSPEVIYKPGDDISFVDDTTIIDDYVHIHVPMVKKKKYTTLPEKSIATNTTPSKKKENLETSAVATSKEDLNDSKTSGHGYVYDKPKIPFNF